MLKKLKFTLPNQKLSHLTSNGLRPPKQPQLLSKNDAWHAIYQTREHEETVISKVSNISFKATCFCYNENTSEAEAERGRGQSQVIKRLVLLFSISCPDFNKEDTIGFSMTYLS